MDGENNGKPYEQMDDLGGKHPHSWTHPHLSDLKSAFATVLKNAPLEMHRCEPTLSRPGGSDVWSVGGGWAVLFQCFQSTSKF